MKRAKEDQLCSLACNISLVGIIRRVGIGIVFIGIVMSGVQVVSAQEILDQENAPSWTGGAMNIQTVNLVGQSFKTSCQDLTSVDVDLIYQGGLGVVTARILRNDSPIAHAQTSISEDGWVHLIFDSAISVTPGETLVLRLESDSFPLPLWKFNSDTYAEGTRLFFVTPQAGDFFFRTYCAQTNDHFDHFLSYKIKHKAVVFLENQFIQGFFTIGKPAELLNPTDKDNEGIIDPDTHLISYKIKGNNFEEVKNVLVENQLGEFVMDMKTPVKMFVPASKSLIGKVVPAPGNSNHNLDHFLCHLVGHNGNVDIQVSVVDQFNQPKLLKIRTPKLLCNPVDKNGEGIKNPQNHLLCFSARRVRGEPKHDQIRGIFVNDQFGSGRVDTKREKELCVPSTITLP